MNKKIIILTAGLLTCIYATGQVKHEFSVYGGGGLSTLLYKPVSGTQTNGYGGLAGLGYTLFFNDYVGIGTGAEVALYNAKAELGAFSSQSDATDISGEAFLYKTKIDKYEEKQKATTINVPLMLNFQTGGYHRFYAAVGAKLGIPLSASYEYTSGPLTASGYYAYEDYEYTDQRFLGFGTFDEENEGKGDLKFKLAYMASAELGMKWSLGKNTALYTGLYVDYGLNDISKREGGIGVYNAAEPQESEFNSILASQYSKSNGKYGNLTDKVSPLAAGIKLKLAFGKGICKEKKKDEEEKDGKTGQKGKDKDKTGAKDSTDANSKLVDANGNPIPQLTEEELKAEREAYLKNAQERRKKYKQALNDVDKYGLSVVTLNAIQKQTLDPYIEQMKREPGQTVKITGHTCDIGSDAVNMKIGQERADLAKDYMVEEGIAPSRIKTFTMGKGAPLVPNTNEANRKKNRRLEIEVVK